MLSSGCLSSTFKYGPEQVVFWPWPQFLLVPFNRSLPHRNCRLDSIIDRLYRQVIHGIPQRRSFMAMTSRKSISNGIWSLWCYLGRLHVDGSLVASGKDAIPLQFCLTSPYFHFLSSLVDATNFRGLKESATSFTIPVYGYTKTEPRLACLVVT